MIKLYTTILAVFFLSVISAQLKEEMIGSPFVQNFKPIEYKGEPQVNCVATDSRGVLYFGHNTGLSVFDGQEWDYIDLNHKEVTSIFVREDDRILVGSLGEFGELISNESGELVYECISCGKTDVKGEIFGIVSIGENTFFTEFAGIHVMRQDSLHFIPEEITVRDVYTMHDNPYFYLEQEGLFFLNTKRELVPYASSGILEGLRINEILPFKEDSILIVASNGLYKSPSMKISEITPIHIPDSLHKYIGGLFDPILKDYYLIIDGGGIIRYSEDMVLKEIYDVENGIISNSVNDFIFTIDGQLAVCTGNGISIANTASPVRKVGKSDGVFGPLEYVFLGDELYVCGLEGLFVLNSSTGKFDAINNHNEKCYGGGVVDSSAYFILFSGVFERNGYDVEFFSGDYAWSMLQYNEDLLIIGAEYEVVIYTKDSITSKWKSHSKYPVEGNAKTIVKEENGDVWIAIEHGQGAVLKLAKNDSTESHGYFDPEYFNEDAFGTQGDFKVFKVDDRVLFGTSDGIKEYVQGKMVPSKVLGSEMESLRDFITMGYQDLIGNTWLSIKEGEQIKKIGFVDATGTYNHSVFSKLNENLIYSAVASDSDHVWLAGPEGLYVYSYANERSTDFNIFCKKIHIGDSLVFSGFLKSEEGFQTNKSSSELIYPYGKTAISFTFAAPTFLDVKETKFRFYLEGFDDFWSEWGARNDVSYTNLPEGDYTLKCQAMNANGMVSEESSISFTVTPPWYRTWWFMLIVSILALSLIYFFFMLRTAALRRRQKELEQTVEERTAEVVEQKKEAEKQRDIADDQRKEAEQQKRLAEEQRMIVEEKNHEILDSINYAERLQLAILPSKKDLTDNLGNSFVLFQPKDVVSGDFYWTQKVGENTFFAAADCTGHGVPGAMVSVVCSNALNRSVKEFALTEPKDILNKTRELVIETFATSGEGVKDGMDIALIRHNSEGMVFAGANNPLWIVRDKKHLTEEQKDARSTVIDENLILVEYSANKQPVGLYEGMKDFQQVEVPMFEGDTLYIFTDGFADQFGGVKGKKFKYKPFKRYLISINELDMEAQKEAIHQTFEDWKGDIEQVDDVCIIGVQHT